MKSLKLFPRVVFTLLGIYLGLMVLPYQVMAATKTVTHKITATAGNHGSISPKGAATVNENAQSPFYTFKPDSGYTVASVIVDGTPLTPIPESYSFLNVTAAHTINVKFALSSYSIIATAGAGGNISPSGTSTVSYNASEVFTITPNTGYQISSIVVDGNPWGNTLPAYTFSNVAANHRINVTFSQVTYQITATAGNHGSISPSGKKTVNYGASQSYAIKPDTGYLIAGVMVDGIPVAGVISSYPFSNITANHTISVTFAQFNYKITVTAGNHGSISPGTTSVNYNTSQTFTMTPDAGYQIAGVTVDGNKLSGTPPSYTFPNVAATHTISATFAVATYQITATAGSHGSISPSGATSINDNGSQVYQIKPDSGYKIATVTVDGVPLTAAQVELVSTQSSYTFDPVTAGHNISVTFTQVFYTITATAGGGGSISPSGVTSIDYNASQVYTITPNTGYHVNTVTVNGTKLTTTPLKYTFSNVNASDTITVTFAVDTYTITATAGSGGTIFPSGVISFNYGIFPAINITPANGYIIDVITVNGSPVDLPNGVNMAQPYSYTFTGVTSSQTIHVTFKNLAQELYNQAENAIANYQQSPDAANLSNAVSNIALVQPYNNIQFTSGIGAYDDVRGHLAGVLYAMANNAIKQYQSAPNNANLQSAVADVILLVPYNDIQLNGVVGYYDDSVNRLTQDVTDHLYSKNNINLAYAKGVSADSSFASDVAVDGAGNVYVSVPSNNTVSGLGVIYEFQKNLSQFLTVAPVAPLEGDHFGRTFAINGNTLIASSEPANGVARVYVFTFQNNQWVQQTILDLTTLTGISMIHQIDLALSGTSVVVGLPEYGKYLVFDHDLAANVAVNAAWKLDLTGSLQSNDAPVAQSVAADGNYIVIGAPYATGSFIRILNQTAGDSTHIFNWQATDFKSGNSGFGTSVAVSQATAKTVTVAIGSPKENKGVGAVYTMTGQIGGTVHATAMAAGQISKAGMMSTITNTKNPIGVQSSAAWLSPQAVNLLMNSSTTMAGSEIALNGSMLTVGANQGIVMVYKLNNNNQWYWSYTSGPAPSVTSSMATDGTTAVVGNQYTGAANCDDYTGSGPCPQSNIEVVEP